MQERVSGTNRAASTKMTMPTGMLMRNTLRQPSPQRSASTSHPPSTGPATAASPLTPPISPYMGARSRGVYRACTEASSCGTMSAANSPCAMRVATSTSPDQAAAACGGREREAGDADEEHPAPAEQVAEPAARDEPTANASM